MALEEDKPVPFGHAADIVSAAQKDAQYSGVLRAHICGSLEEIVGPRRAAPWVPMAGLVSDALYKVTSAFSRGRTLGEEYSELLAVRNDLTRLSPVRRLATTMLTILPSFWFSTQPFSSRPGRNRGSWMRRLFAFIVDSFPTIVRTQLALFYIFGLFHTVVDRAFGIRYISIGQNPKRSFSYRPLGFLLLTQVIGEICIASMLSRKKCAMAEGDAHAVASVVATLGGDAVSAGPYTTGKQPFCGVCMCRAEVATSTPCGHIFCWYCIAPWAAEKATCPLCRISSPPQELVPLMHYEVPDDGPVG